MYRFLFTAAYLLLFGSLLASGQKPNIVMGPVPGHSTDTSSILWMLVSDTHLSDTVENQNITTFDELDNYLYEYAVQHGYDAIHYNLKEVKYIHHYGTLKIHLSKEENPPEEAAKAHPSDFSFTIGSCVFPFPYKILNGEQRYNIFEKMMQKSPDFMVWMGDNVYYLDQEWESYEQMYLKNVKARLQPELGNFLKSCPQYAIWDDHDFGPNNSDGSFSNKKAALSVFKDFWPNPDFGNERAQGVFFNFKYEDAEFFMLDNRYHKINDIQMLGLEQMKWLKSKLVESSANFKFIVTGSQMLANYKRGESFEDCPEEKEELLYFLEKKNISGVVFLNGDRHYTELNYLYRTNEYPLHEFTCSPLTSIWISLILW